MAIPLIGPDGREYELDNSDPAALDEVLRQGYKQQLPKYVPQGLGEEIAAAGAEATDIAGTALFGGLRGATAGLSDVALAAKSPEAGAFVKQQREAHPIAAGAGELAGMIVSPINKVGAAVRGGIGATTAIGRIGSAAAAEGVEGLLYGAGNTMSDAALGDYDLTAEKMVAGVGLGGVLGLAGGGVGAGLAEGFKAVVPRVGKMMAGAKGPLEEFAESRWLKAGGGIQSDIKKIPEGERAAVANVIREAMSPTGKILPGSLDEAAETVALERDAISKQLMKEIGVGDAGGLLPKMDKDEALAALNRGFKENGEKVGRVLEDADKMGARPSFSGALAKFDNLESGLNPAERDIIAPDLARARKYILEMGNAPAGSPKNSFSAMNSLKSTLQGDINWAADSGAKNTLKKKLVGIIKGELDDQFAVQMGPEFAAEFQAAKAAYGALKNAAKAVKGKNATGADAIAALVKDASLAAPSLGGKLSALEHATKLIKHGQDRQLGNRWVSSSDYLTGLAASASHPLGALAALPAAIAHKLIREKGSAVIAKLTDYIAASPRMKIAATSFGGQLQEAAPNLGEYGAPLLQAFAHSPETGLATHMLWAQANPDYAEKAQLAGFLPETAEEMQHANAKGDALAAVAHTLDAQNTEIGKSLDAVFRGSKPPRAPSQSTQDFGAKRMRAKDSATAHRKRVDEIREMAANPDALLERVVSNMGDVSDMAPGVAAAMTRTAHAAVTYLAKASEEPPKAGPLARSWVPTQAEQHDFAMKLEVVERPMSVLRHAAAGTLVPAQWEAVQTVYPLLARQIQDLAMERLADPPKDVPYRARLMLGMITGIDVDGTMGAAVALNQQAIGAKESKQPSMSREDSKESALTLGDRTATRSQKREMDNGEA